MFLSNDEKYNTTGITELNTDRRQQTNRVNVYTLGGQCVRSSVERGEATRGLPAGIYVVDGKKIIVR
jgi:hypothetical protein